MPTIRTSSILYVSNAPSIVVPFPAGSVAEDTCVIFTGHGFVTNIPSGWTASQNLTGSNFNGAAIYKILTPADITAGSVTITFSGTYYGLVAAVTMVGMCDAWITNAYRNNAGAATRALATGGAPAAGNVVLWFGAGRANNIVTSDRGTVLQTTSNNEASGALYSETLAAAGAVTATFTYSTTPTGDFGAVVVLADRPPGFNVSKEEALAWYEPPAGFDVSKEEALAWYEPPAGFDVSKMEVLAWLDIPPPRRRNPLIVVNESSGILPLIPIVVFQSGYEGTTIVDEGELHQTVTLGGTAGATTTRPKFGSKSLEISGFHSGGGGEGITVPAQPVMNIGTKPWTAETFISFMEFNQGGYTMISQADYQSATGASWDFWWRYWYGESDFIALDVYSNADGSGPAVSLSSANQAWVLNTWYHFAADFDGLNYRLYVNGNMVAKAPKPAWSPAKSTAPLSIGTDYYGGEVITPIYGAFMDETRVIIGRAVYATDAGFTPPVAPLPRPLPPSPSYTNPGGTGNRTATITTTITAMGVGGGNVTQLVDGSQADAFWWTSGTNTGAEFVRFDFGTTRIIDAFKWYQNTGTSHGTWQFEGSNDGTTYTMLTSLALTGSSTGIEFAFTNETAYRYYRLRAISGARSQSPYLREIEFRIE